MASDFASCKRDSDFQPYPCSATDVPSVEPRFCGHLRVITDQLSVERHTSSACKPAALTHGCDTRKNCNRRTVAGPSVAVQLAYPSCVLLKGGTAIAINWQVVT